jgi:hypothetical protein
MNALIPKRDTAGSAKVIPRREVIGGTATNSGSCSNLALPKNKFIVKANNPATELLKNVRKKIEITSK